MVLDVSKKEKAIKLRREGRTYSEILKEVSVAKSTLTEWFRSVKLTTPQFQRLTERKLAASKRGGIAKREQRIVRANKIHNEALSDISNLTQRELWLIGVALYWAEGSKEKDYQFGSGVKFGNSDSRMVRVFLKFLYKVCGAKKEDLIIEIYIHENSKNNIDVVRKYWSEVTGFGLDKLNKVYYKKNKIKTNRKNTGDLYYGGIRVKVRSSSTLLRRIAGWTEAIYRNI